ncbi:MAG: hypothetical protein VB030_05655 [Eubacterium aggregans]|uniref:hypothetical protein n=1 Tax=Eubacterium aggregans TaxID=81409 RepID=UPI002B1FF41E|nr:hypothetical protein [Eubacterium aggregans]MEA5073638.1 hypothetical protein [Eubacterium aggregans]
MAKKLLYNRRIMGYVLLFGMGIFLLLHLLVCFGTIPYSSLWGTAITSQASLMKAEGFAVFFILLFMIGIVLELFHFRVSPRLPRGLLWGMVVYMGLNTLGYLRCDAMSLKIGMSLFCLFLALLGLWMIFLSHRAERRRRMRQKRQKRHQ